MQYDGFKDWLTRQGQAPGSISTRLSDAKRVEKHFGDLDAAFAKDGGASIIADLTYTSADRAAGKANTTGIEIDGDLYDSLATCKAAVVAYLKFLNDEDATLEQSQADSIRQYVSQHYASPAKAKGQAQFNVVSGDVHKDMALSNAMPAVCQVLDGKKLAALVGTTLVGREGPKFSSTVSYTFQFIDRGLFSIAGVEQELRKRYGEPISSTSGSPNQYIVAFELSDIRQIALEREGGSVRIWLEDTASDAPPPCEQFTSYVPEQGRQSNLPSRLKHNPPAGIKPRAVIKVTIGDWPTLAGVLDWYDSQGTKGGALTREVVFKAMDECDQDTVDAFVKNHGFKRPRSYWIADRGNLYPCKAIANVALRAVHGNDTPIWDATRSREIIAQLGFTVVKGDGPEINLEELEKLRKRFLELLPDFEPEMFRGHSGAYFDHERNYKNVLIKNAQAIILDEALLSDEELGARFLDLLTGPESGVLSWRTDARIKNLRADHPNVLEAEAGSLIRSREEVIAAAQTFATNTWPILIEGKEKSLPYSESRNIPSMLLALACPQDALGINTEPLRKIYKALTGKNLFGANPMTSGEHEEILSFAQILFDKFEEWGWQPRDLWDVQSFIWVVKGDPQDEANNSPSNLQEAQRPMSQPTNLILYGPPGTGKTYQTAFEAVALCDGTAPEDRKELTVRYDALVEAGQIRFVTFHQSYSYEDFVEGLRPVTGNEDGEDPSAATGFRLEPRQGIFREIAALAEQARRNEGRSTGYDLTGKRFFKMSLGRAGSEDHIFDAAIDGGYIVLGWGGDVDWSDSRYDEYQSIFDKWNEIEPGTSGNAGNISQLWTFRSSIKEGDLIVASDGNSNFRAIGEVTGPYVYAPTDVREYNHRRAIKWLLVLDESLPVETIHEGKFTMRSCYELRLNRMKLEALSRLLPGNSAPLNGRPDQFVLIIDEINRANISKVFGELITLIEADKRIGSENMLTVKLPYSGDIFGVPNNLHLLGTMNTADRSIALLDTALRRRFTFKELMPDHTKLAEAAERTSVNLPAVLKSLNDRIEFLFDREHQIGHAYFMPCNTVSDVDDVMRFKIIPLLAEYFYEDWSKVALVLGDAEGAGNFIERTKLNPPSGIQNEGFEDARYRWVVCNRFSASAYDQFG